MDEITDCNNNGLSPCRNADYEKDRFDESPDISDSERDNLDYSEDLRNSSERKRRSKREEKDSQEITSHGQKPTYGSQNALRFNCISEQEELKIGHRSNDESEDLSERVTLPHIDTCVSESEQRKPRNSERRESAVVNTVNEISLPSLKGKCFLPKRKNAVSSFPALKSSISLPSLKTPSLVNTVNGSDCKLSTGSDSFELASYTDDLTMADRSEMNSLHWPAKRSRQKSRTLRRKFDGLTSPFNYGRSLSKR
ncbi:hypothetical protein OS493_032436 [Desmophyllum pertusum]|uniref:Uncharacterized protein n=1 Tax=Desmophyllum pertusum TaxID=174260 RepID=A0A9X0D8Y0_9CNID|nr:hypothetical protein OS493_032436 [Desmophyllum pertusum]